MRKFSEACMKNSRILAGLLPALLCFLPACRQASGPEQAWVARVGTSYLYRSDLEAMLPRGLLPLDSLETARKKVASWVSQQVLLQRAEENMDERAAGRIERQIEDYRKSLMIFNYEENITRQLLDTVVLDKEIEEYYRQHQDQFVLKSNIVRVRFVKVSKQSKHLARLKEGLFSASLENDGNLFNYAELCRDFSENFFLDGDKWLYFNDFLREVPVKTYNQEEFLKHHRNIEVEAGSHIYYVSILDFRIRDMLSPLSFEQDRIRAIVLNQRKKALLDKMEKDLLQEAVRSGMVEYYDGGSQDEVGQI